MKKTEGNKVGRPKTSVAERIEEKHFDLDVIEKLAIHGLTDKELCNLLKINEATLNRWKEDTEFMQVLKEGKLKADARVERKLFERATGYEHEDLFISQYQGQIIKESIVKHYPPDATSLIFWLKNRQPERWREKTEVNLNHNVHTQFDVGKLTNDDLAQLSNMLKRIQQPAELVPVEKTNE